MASKAQQNKSEHLAKVIALVYERLEGKKADEVAKFVDIYYQGLVPEDILSQSAENLYGAALSIYKFSAKRQPGQVKIRSYNPNLEQHGWRSPHTIIEIVNDDMPFLVDSVMSALTQRGLGVHLVIHPVFRMARNGDGNRTAILPPLGNGAEGGETVPRKKGAQPALQPESVMHVEVDEQSDPAVLKSIEQSLHEVLADVRASVEDWRPMLARVKDLLAQLSDNPPRLEAAEVEEAEALLEWMADDHFTFLGYREYDYRKTAKGETWKIVPGSGLGLLRDPNSRLMSGKSEMSPEIREFLHKPELVIVAKATTRSTVHRAVHMDYIGVKKFNAKGEPVGEYRFAGLFTSSAYNRSPRDIPFLRRKVQRTIKAAGYLPGSHSGKGLLHILESYPRDELFQISVDELVEIANGILALQERPRIRIFPRYDRFQRFVSLLVFVPRERYNTDLRQRFENVLATTYRGRISAYYTQIGDAPLARLHFIVGLTPGEMPEVDHEKLEERLVEASRDWTDNLHDALIEHCGEERGLALWHRYGAAFPTAYREIFNAKFALFDIEKVEGMAAANGLALNLYRQIEDPDHVVRFKIYNPGESVPLSDCLPMIEHMGLKVVDENPFRVSSDPVCWIHDFRLVDPKGQAIALDEGKDKFEEAFAKVWTGEVEDDGFNRLVLHAGLGWDEVVVIRAYCKFLRQAGITFSQSYMENVLAGNPAIARLLVDLFGVRFDPEHEGGRAKRAEAIRTAIEGELELVRSLDADRILRRFLNLIDCTLRTNFYQRDGAGARKPYLSFKLDSAHVDGLPLPRPAKEIFVYSPDVEGVHLRGGDVARGGLRWSDRREDFRTEILSLMKAQMVKNAVIVPVGSKGGFVPKALPAGGGRDEVLAEGVRCYRLFISGLLDLTDNLAGGKVVPPENVVRHDGDDPYLVVAADKGTATFSDIANEVSQDYGFWLGDAFASGGAEGYDHKKMGITARGAWESVKRHFREMGRDIQKEAFTVVGVGDMSGDVFGNGMLLSEHIRLVAAFDHRNIFIDPTPRADKAFEERARLFKLPRSSWEDYDPALISRGGGVFDRKAKSLALSPEIRKLFGIAASSMAPNDLIRHILKAEVDLLWFGGIGTYVKAKDERNPEVGDRANDAVRVTAGEVRAKVIGEGANLGITQRGRIEYALKGGRLNTDAIDNSAGVDCSDHEVNIKILLGQILDDGEMTLKQRNRLLADMTDEVAELVLRDNYLQTQALTVAQGESADRLEEQARFMRALEREGRLNRAIEFLPDDETLDKREAARLGLARPEMAVLLSYAKMTLYDDLLASDLPDDAYFKEDLLRYFPAPLRKEFGSKIGAHRLRREIISTQVTNSLVNRAGFTFVRRMSEELGASPSQIARAYTAVREIFSLRGLWDEIEALDNKAPAEVQTESVLEIQSLLRRSTLWCIRNLSGDLDVAKLIAGYRPDVELLTGRLDELLNELGAQSFNERRADLVERGMPEELARRIALLGPMTSMLDVVEAAKACDRPVEEAGLVYFATGARLGLDWLRLAATKAVTKTHWDRLALASLIDDLYGQQRALTNSVFRGDAKHSGLAALDHWVEANQGKVARCDQLINDIKSSGSIDIAKLTFANRQIRAMIA